MTHDSSQNWRERIRATREIFRQFPATFGLVWRADWSGAIAIGAMSVISALLPPGAAWVGKLIIDSVVAASRSGSEGDRHRVLFWVGVEMALMVSMFVVGRLQGFVRDLMRARLGNLINEQILDKALALELRHFEDSEVHDKMQNARREASARPLALVLQAFAIGQNAVTLAAYAALLVTLSPWAVVILVVASIPSFVAEARLAGDSFRLHSWRAPEGRRFNYLEWILTRDDHAKEVKLYNLGGYVLQRYRALFAKFFLEDRKLALRRMGWGVLFGAVSLTAFYGCYAVVAGRAARSEISLGDMTLYLAVFRQSQSAMQNILSALGSMYEDALFMSNLFAFLQIPVDGERARHTPALVLPAGRRLALELRSVSFRYPGKETWALKDVSLRIAPGEKLGLVGENGAGKSTLVKLLLRFYDPTDGQILVGGIDLRDLDPQAWRARVGAVFQDYVRYQFTAGENIGLGLVESVEDRSRIARAAELGGASELIDSLPRGYDTVLGGWFEKGQQLSAGQWQKLALARAFMRESDFLMFDEPTASIDAEGEHDLLQRFQRLAADRTTIVISHRFATVRLSDTIAVLHHGRLEELGSHETLMERDGRYARLFRLQAQGYQPSVKTEARSET